MVWHFHPSPCQCPALAGETDDGANRFNSQMMSTQRETASQQGPEPWRGTSGCSGPGHGAAGGELCIHSAASETMGSNRKVFAGKTEAGAALEMGIAGGSRGATRQAEPPRASPCLWDVYVTPLNPSPWCPAVEGAKEKAGERVGVCGARDTGPLNMK